MSTHGDPRLTAYALGECDDAERAEVEALLAADPAARDEVEAVRAAAGMLEAALAGAPLPSLEPARRAALVGKEAGTPEPVPAPVLLPGGKPRRARPLVGAAAAATLLGIAFGVAGYSTAIRRSDIHMRSPGLPNYSGAYLDGEIALRTGRPPAGAPSEVYDNGGIGLSSNPSGKPSSGAFYNDRVEPPSGAKVTITGSLPEDLQSLKVVQLNGPVDHSLPGVRGLQAEFDEQDGPGSGSGMGGSTGGAGPEERVRSLGYLGAVAGGQGDGSGGSPDSPPFPGSTAWRVGAAGGGGGGGGHLYKGPAGEVPVLMDIPTVGYLFTDNRSAELPGFDRFTVGGGVSPQTVFLPKPGVVVDEAAVRLALGKAAVQPLPVVVRRAGPGNDIVIDLPNNRFGEEHPRDSTTESSTPIVENPWIRPVGEAALSTFSVDVDTAGYTIVRRCLTQQNRLPEPASVRIEELVNYFPWDYEPPSGTEPFAVHAEAAACPWEPRHRLVRVALKGRMVDNAVRPPANFVFLLDVSGSMNQPNKLPLVKESIKLLAGRLDARDRVAIVVYAGASGLVLPPTAGNDSSTILNAIDRLAAGGSTNGGAGIELAYRVAQENFVPGGINRVILATDGDFNVGVTNRAALTSLIEEKAKTKVFLTALGYGMDNLKDDTLEVLADKGNGNYGYVDDLAEARRLLVDQGMSTLHTIAKDVKIQVEFNPAKVSGYRLLGYENRVLAAQDFADDRKDAGEIGAGHAVTAFYEVVPAGEAVPGAAVDELRYQRPGAGNGSPETLTVKLRWKEPEGDESALREVPFTDAGGGFDAATEDFRFAAAVVEWGLLLRGSRNAAGASFSAVQEIASGACSRDEGGWKAEFLRLVALSAGMRR